MTGFVNFGIVKRRLNSSNTKVLGYSQELYHIGLNEHKIVSATDTTILTTKVRIQIDKWDEKWTQLQEKNRNATEKETNMEEAERRSKETAKQLKDIENILLYSLNTNNAINWGLLLDDNEFRVNNPVKPIERKHKQYPQMPNKDAKEFSPDFSIFEHILKSLKQKKIIECENRYNLTIDKWKNSNNDIDKENKKMDEAYSFELKRWQNEVIKWEANKLQFSNSQKIHNQDIEKFRDLYLKYDENAIFEYNEMVLNNSKYPFNSSKKFQIEYNPQTKILIVDYTLPAPDDMPNVKEVTYVASRKELKVNHLTEPQIEKLYDSTIYKITLRTIHELFEADVINAISAISFNGWVNFLNKSNGKMDDACIVSIQVKKDAFSKVDLKLVEPKACFKSLKGIGSSKLIQITPIRPILEISKEDKRFIPSYDVVSGLDEAKNLASMDWEDFEHLIRELFEKEFSQNGGEVKVTRASRDGGVDAIAFDPDPIRGGKIVIQAKRYTNTVGVSAVRDLYGTVVNEGATKGILVTTSDYGPDSYSFATNKPITLLNGSNLLYLLEKHGHHAVIDLKDAKRELNLKI